MSDPRSDDIVEIQLREAFRGPLPTAPASLRDALERAADVPVRTAAGRTNPRRRGWGLLAVAAVLLVGGAVAVSVGQRGPDVAPSPTIPVVTLTYDVAWLPERPENGPDIASVEAILHRRLELLGVTDASVQNAGHGRFVVTVPASVSIDGIRRLLGTRGEVAGVPLGDTSAEEGDVLDPSISARLFGGDGIAEAGIDMDETGRRVIELTLAPRAARDFEAWTAANIGKYFAITVDGTVLTAPVINSSIPGGHVRIESGGVNGFDLDKARQLVAIVDPGPLPLELIDTSAIVTPAPSNLLLRSSSPPAPVVSPAVSCGAAPTESGPILACDEAIDAARSLLPATHPGVSRIRFDYSCADVTLQRAAHDCAVQFFGVVEFMFVDGAAPVRVQVSSAPGGPLVATLIQPTLP